MAELSLWDTPSCPRCSDPLYFSSCKLVVLRGLSSVLQTGFPTAVHTCIEICIDHVVWPVTGKDKGATEVWPFWGFQCPGPLGTQPGLTSSQGNRVAQARRAPYTYLNVVCASALKGSIGSQWESPSFSWLRPLQEIRCKTSLGRGGELKMRITLWWGNGKIMWQAFGEI